MEKEEELKITYKMVEEIYQSGWLLKCCRNYAFDLDVAEDFQSEVMIKIMTTPNPKLISLYLEGDKYLAYIYTIVRNEWINKSSKVFKLLRLSETYVRLDGENDEIIGGFEEDEQDY